MEFEVTVAALAGGEVALTLQLGGNAWMRARLTTAEALELSAQLASTAIEARKAPAEMRGGTAAAAEARAA